MISTHVLDQSEGMPATDLEVSLQIYRDENWQVIKSEKTNSDGRISFDNEAVAGTYRLVFELDPYFERKGISNFFVRTPIVFKIQDTGRKYHVPLLLNPYGYSTYRGS